MKNYAKGKPVGNNLVPFYDSPVPEISLASFGRDNAAASSILLLNSATTAVEVQASGSPAYVKWLSQSVVDSSVAGTSVISTGSTSNFDGMVPANTVRRFIVPIATVVAPPATYGTLQGANKDNNLYPAVAIKSGSIGSVATIEN